MKSVMSIGSAPQVSFREIETTIDKSLSEAIQFALSADQIRSCQGDLRASLEFNIQQWLKWQLIHLRESGQLTQIQFEALINRF